MPPKTATQSNPYRAGFIKGILPDPYFETWQWADQYRKLSSVTSGEPGQWRTSRTPYLKEIMSELSTRSTVKTVIFSKGSQIGGTECGLNWIGKNVHLTPGPMLIVHPSKEVVERWSRQRLAPMIHSTPVLSARIQDPSIKNSGNTILMKEFPGGFLAMAGSNSPAQLRSMPVRFLFCDDIDAFAENAGNEGDPVELAKKRTANFSNKKIFLVSTPTEKGVSRIERAYENSDQRKYFVPCPKCEEMEPLTWAQIKWPTGQPERAYCECFHCGYHMQDHHKTKMFLGGEWRATAESKDPETVGFHLSSLYSPHGWLSWSQCAQQFVSAKPNVEDLRVFVNTVLGETFDDGGGDFDKESLLGRREPYTPELLPDGVALLTAAVDVQDDRLEVQIDGYGKDKEYYNIDYIRIMGDPSVLRLDDDPDNLSVWKLARDQLQRVFTHPRYGSMKILSACVDTGGHHTLKAYEFCRACQASNVWAIKGRAGRFPLWPTQKPSRKNKGKVPLYLLGVDTGKSSIYSSLRVETPGPSYRHYPEARDDDYFKQLTSERRRTKYSKGFPTHYWYLPSGERNEALDLSVYSLAALEGLLYKGIDLNKRVQKLNEQFPDAKAYVLKNSSDDPPKDLPPRRPENPTRDGTRRRSRRSSYMG